MTLLVIFPFIVLAEPITVNWWFAHGGRLGEKVQSIVADFNASQSQYKVVATYKGNYADTMMSGIAAFRAKNPPHILQVYEVGTATMMAAKGAISWIHMENFSAWHNVPIGNKSNGFEGLDTEFVFNSPLHVKHIQQLADWQKEKVFVYGGRRNKGNALFSSGQVGMYTESSAGYAGFKKTCKFEFGTSMLPYWPDASGAPQNTIIGGASLWVLQGHTPQEYKGVAAFFNYLSKPEVQADWHKFTGCLPITLAAYDLKKKQGFYKENPQMETALKQMTLNKPTENSRGLRFGNFVQMRGIMYDTLEAIFTEKATAEKGLSDAVAKGNRLLRKFEKANK